MAEDPDQEEETDVSPEAVAAYAKAIGLLDAAPNRISYLLIMQLYLQADGIADIAARVVIPT